MQKNNNNNNNNKNNINPDPPLTLGEMNLEFDYDLFRNTDLKKEILIRHTSITLQRSKEERRKIEKWCIEKLNEIFMQNNNNCTDPYSLNLKIHEDFKNAFPKANETLENLILAPETEEVSAFLNPLKQLKLEQIFKDLEIKPEFLRPNILFHIIKVDKEQQHKELHLTSFKTITKIFGPDKFRTKSGKTLLMHACKYQNLSYIRHLMTLKPGPDLYAETKHGLTFLDYMPKLNGRMDILNIIFPPNETVYILDFWSNESMCPIFSDFENPNSGIVKGFEEDVKLGVLYICFKSYDLACMVRNYINDREKEFMRQFNLSHAFVTVLNSTKATNDDKCFFDGFGKVEIMIFIKKSIGKKFGEG